jgi:tRNA 2-thiouridine synthesizing protein B
MILHTFNNQRAFHVSRAFVQETDQILFLEDGVYCLLDKTLDMPDSNIYILQADMDARGLADRIGPEIHRVDYEGFVQLCCDADSVSNWF